MPIDLSAAERDFLGKLLGSLTFNLDSLDDALLAAAVRAKLQQPE